MNRGTLKSPTYLLETLYYRSDNFEYLPFIPYIASQAYSGTELACMTNANYEVDPTSTITYVGYRIVIPPNSRSGLTENQYHETFTVQTLEGNFSAVATYADAGMGSDTEKPSQEFLVLNGSGKFAYAKSVTIIYDNTLQQRKMLVYAYAY